MARRFAIVGALAAGWACVVASAESPKPLIPPPAAAFLENLVADSVAASRENRPSTFKPPSGARANRALENLVRQRLAGLRAVNPTAALLNEEALEQILTGGQLTVESLTPAISATIASRPGTHPIDGKLRLHVSSASPGWRLLVQSTPLVPVDRQAGGQKIEAGEVYAVTGDGGRLCLEQPQALIVNGGVGGGSVEMELAIVTTATHRPGKYAGVLSIGSQGYKSLAPAPVQVPFEVEVELRASLTVEGGQAYFHFAHLPDSQTAEFKGTVSADAPMQLSLSVLNGLVNDLPLRKPFFVGDHPGSRPIPIEWKLAGPGLAARVPDLCRQDGSSVSWLMSGTPGDTDYALHCTVNPAAIQAPGDYGAQMLITLEPVL